MLVLDRRRRALIASPSRHQYIADIYVIKL